MELLTLVRMIFRYDGIGGSENGGQCSGKNCFKDGARYDDEDEA